MNIRDEFHEKTDRVRSLLQREALAGILLKRQANFSWVTCGGHNNVSMASDMAAASILITPSHTHLICSNIEAPRILAEEIKGLGDDLEVSEFAWHEKSDFEVANCIMAGKKWGSDVACRSARSITTQLTDIRSPLTPNEVDRYKALGKDVGDSLWDIARSLKPDMTEWDVAGRLGEAFLSRGITPAVLLVAADQRIAKFRHPVARQNKIKSRVMIVVNVKRHGLYAAATRIVCFTKPATALTALHESCCRIEAGAMAAARPDNTFGKVFQAILAGYKAEGCPEEWRLHHQGGTIGYDGRDLIFNSQSLKTPILENQSFALNPSITGAKSEDTFLARPKGPQILTTSAEWPVVKCTTEVGVIERPAMLCL